MNTDLIYDSIADAKIRFPDKSEIKVHLYKLIRYSFFESWYSSGIYQKEHDESNKKYYVIFEMTETPYISVNCLLPYLYSSLEKVNWKTHAEIWDDAVVNLAYTIRFATEIGYTFTESECESIMNIINSNNIEIKTVMNILYLLRHAPLQKIIKKYDEIYILGGYGKEWFESEIINQYYTTEEYISLVLKHNIKPLFVDIFHKLPSLGKRGYDEKLDDIVGNFIKFIDNYITDPFLKSRMKMVRKVYFDCNMPLFSENCMTCLVLSYQPLKLRLLSRGIDEKNMIKFRQDIPNDWYLAATKKFLLSKQLTETIYSHNQIPHPFPDYNTHSVWAYRDFIVDIQNMTE